MSKYAKLINECGDTIEARIERSFKWYKKDRYITLLYGYRHLAGSKVYYIWEKRTGARVFTDIGKLTNRAFDKIARFVICTCPIEEKIKKWEGEHGKCGK